jgi:hypothetical protein
MPGDGATLPRRHEDSDRRACPQDMPACGLYPFNEVLRPLVDNAAGAAVRTFDNPLHALSLRHEWSVIGRP